MLTIAQITDIHVCTDRNPASKATAESRLRRVLRAIMALRPRPVAIVASGDLADAGEIDAYTDLQAILAEETDLPIYPGMGNHDLRVNFIKAWDWPADKLDEGFVQYTVDLPGGLRLVMCDTLDEGAAGGAFCETRARWLKRTLDDEPTRPTLVALHHPPLVSGIQWMDPAPDEPWILRLGAVLQGRDNVRRVMCGHLHRAFTRDFAGRLLTVSAATDVELTLDLTPVDMETPDGREILVSEPPAYALHMWNDGDLTTHFCVAGPYPTAVTYDHPFREPTGLASS
jgi:3',5'-cyclic AMP phosphodiesterase CpdA